jgi:hypothetical protein
MEMLSASILVTIIGFAVGSEASAYAQRPIYGDSGCKII